MSSDNKKQRHKAKREAKRREKRRQDSVSPVRRIAEAKGELECWMSADVNVLGQIQVFVLKPAGSEVAFAGFLIDRGVVGIKDAWVRLHLPRAEFDKILDVFKRDGIAVRRAAVEDALPMIGGGIRWANQNGMRLPKELNKALTLIGGVDWQSADVGAFVMEFAGHPEDLRQRLLKEPFETYIRRTDIDFEFSDAAHYIDQKDGEYVDNGLPENSYGIDTAEVADLIGGVAPEVLASVARQFAPVTARLVSRTRAWLESRDISPSPELSEAWQTFILARYISKVAMPDADEVDVARFGNELAESFGKRIDRDRSAEYKSGIKQVVEHISSDLRIIWNVIDEVGLADEPGSQGGAGTDTAGVRAALA